MKRTGTGHGPGGDNPTYAMVIIYNPRTGRLHAEQYSRNTEKCRVDRDGWIQDRWPARAPPHVPPSFPPPKPAHRPTPGQPRLEPPQTSRFTDPPPSRIPVLLHRSHRPGRLIRPAHHDPTTGWRLRTSHARRHRYDPLRSQIRLRPRPPTAAKSGSWTITTTLSKSAP